MWRAMPRNILADLATVFREAGARREASGLDGPATLFFRADDIGAPGRKFERMAGLFRSHRTELGLAVVPAWLTEARRDCLLSILGPDQDLFCLHQHGWRHADHETGREPGRKAGRATPHPSDYPSSRLPAGSAVRKKCEFGPARPYHHKLADLKRGRDRLASLLGGRVSPVFTPPWNRLDADTLDGLARLGFRAVSRSLGAVPPLPGAMGATPGGLVALDVTVDLHTRKAPSVEAAFAGLFADLRASLERGWCGVMLHHPRMDGGAFEFLDALLDLARRTPGVAVRSMDSLLPDRAPVA
jgi:hypothetical protein